jgi:hypothetical protein
LREPSGTVLGISGAVRRQRMPRICRQQTVRVPQGKRSDALERSKADSPTSGYPANEGNGETEGMVYKVKQELILKKGIIGQTAER